VEADRFLVSRTRHAPALRTPTHAHPVICLHLVLDGLYDEYTRSGHHQLEPGWMLFKPGGEPHWNEFRADGATTLRIELEPDAIPELTRRLPARSTSSRSPHLTALARRAHHELSSIDELTPIVAESIALEIFALVARAPAPSRRAGTALAHRCAELLEERFTEPYRLGDAARDLDVDRTVLARAFREAFGRSVGEFIRERRVAYVAARLHSRPHRDLGELALEAGFSDQSHLTRTFKSVYGVPPGAWRARTTDA
jgi:AraC family transcriptional regulator